MQWLKIKCVSIIVILTAFSACKKSPTSTETSNVQPTYQTKEFLDFYDRFGKDSVFQLEHIVFPLEGTRHMKDSLDVVPADFRWQRENWIIHKSFNDKDDQFIQSWAEIKGAIVIESIQDSTGKFSGERRFGKLSSGWHLIYYREFGIY